MNKKVILLTISYVDTTRVDKEFLKAMVTVYPFLKEEMKLRNHN